jgi:hypothetical protein
MDIVPLQNFLCRSHKEAINSYILWSLELELFEELVWNNKATSWI